MDPNRYAKMVRSKQSTIVLSSRFLIILVTALAAVHLQSIAAAIAPSQTALAWLVIGASLTVALAAAALVIRARGRRARARTLLFGLAMGIVLSALFHVAFDPLVAASDTVKAAIVLGFAAVFCGYCCIWLVRAEHEFQTLLGLDTARERSKTG